MTKNRKAKIDNTYLGVIKGLISSLVVCIMSILVYAVVLKSFSMGDESIPYFNQVIKIIGIIITSYYSVKDNKKLYMGTIGGIAFVLVTYLLFSLINGGVGAVSILWSDIVMGAVIGGIFGIIAIRLGKDDDGKRK